jgi:hypothetical protein
MAFKLFGDASQWWRISDVNPQIAFPLDLVPGMEIRIPQ